MLEVLFGTINYVQTNFNMNYSTAEVLKLIQAFEDAVLLILNSAFIKEQRTVKHPAVCNSLSTYSPTFLIMNVYPTELEGKTTELSYPFFTDSVLSKEKKNEYITHKTQSLLIHVCTVQISEHKLKMEVTNAIYSTTLK